MSEYHNRAATVQLEYNNSMAGFHTVYVRLGRSSLPEAKVGPLAADDAIKLTRKMHRALLKSPEGFVFSVRLEGLAEVRMRWEPLSTTAGAVLILPLRGPIEGPPDAVAILLTGLESADDMTRIVSRFPLTPDIWDQVQKTLKPVAVAAFFLHGRFRDPATITTISACANAFFSSLGSGCEPPPDDVPDDGDHYSGEGGL